MTPRRLHSVDAIRGVAVMGILLMNVTSFALPSGAYFNPRATGTPTIADLAVWAVMFVAVDGKMRALFSILFGASTLIVVERAAAAGRDPARAHLARMAVLALFGVAHGVLLWPGDILFHYALVGVAALPLTTLEPGRLLRVALLLLLAQATIQGAVLLDDVRMRAAANGPGADIDAIAQWRTFSAGVGIGAPADVAREIALRLGPWTALVADNAHGMMRGAPFLLLFDGPETLAYMALGMAALRTGFLRGGWPRRRYATIAALALGIGLPLSALLAWAAARSGFDTLATFAAATLGGIGLRPAIALGYAAALLALRVGGKRLTAVGRVAFSNYLATSLLMCALFEGWGLGLFGHLDRAQIYTAVPLVWLAMLAWSRPWLDRFAHGPLEWCWRSLARWERQGFRNPIETS